MLRLGSVFSGIGAIEQALIRLKIKYQIAFACDIDPFVKQSYLANYPVDPTAWYDDIHLIKGAKYKNKIDLLMGGSPCQSFSMVGKRKGLDDPRGLLIYQFSRLIKEARPKVFIYENVKGLLSHKGAETWEILKKEFKSTGYDYHVTSLNARNYGIPQNRERLFIVGFRKANPLFKFPTPIPLTISMKDLLQDSADSKYILPTKGVAFVTKNKNIKKRYTQIDGNVALCQKANQQFNWHGDFVTDYRSRLVDEKYYLSDKVAAYVTASGTKSFYSKPATDLDVARPLLSTMHKMHRAGVDNYVTRGNRIRKLTPRECLRLMGFNDNFKIVVSDTQMYRQAGNAIVVDVLVALIKSIELREYADN